MAINDTSDSLDRIKNFPVSGEFEDDNLTFPFFKAEDGENALTLDKFNDQGGYPTTVIIDRNGKICMIEAGAILSVSEWEDLFEFYTAENYP